MAVAAESAKPWSMEIDVDAESVRYGSIYRAKVERVDTSLDAVFVSLGNGLEAILNNADILLPEGKGKTAGQKLGAGQTVLVQVKTGVIGSDGLSSGNDSGERKLPRVSMDITLQGRYIVYAPMIQKAGISKRIRNPVLRGKLQEMMKSVEGLENCLLRAAAANSQTDMLVREAGILKDAWLRILDHQSGSGPEMLMVGPSAVQRMLSNVPSGKVLHAEAVDFPLLAEAEEWCRVFAPDLVTRLVFRGGDGLDDLSLLMFRDLEQELEKLCRPYVLLPGGGSIILQETAALTAVDVNRGSDRRSPASINLEAAQELSRQLRLRNIGGIVMVDFLRVKAAKSRQSLEQKLEQLSSEDPCSVRVHGQTPLGLTEMSRQRRTPSLSEILAVEPDLFFL